MQREIHIASWVAHVRPESLANAIPRIESGSLGEVPRSDPRVRLVILIERDSSAGVLDSIDAIRAIPGVLAVHLAYQHIESESHMEEQA